MDIDADLEHSFRSQLGISSVPCQSSSSRYHGLASEPQTDTLTSKGLVAQSSVGCKFLLLPLEIRHMIYRCVFEVPRIVRLSSTEPCLYPAVLQASRQIYQEAAALLHSELTIQVPSGNVLSLATDILLLDVQEPETLGRGLWGHNPLDGVGHENPDGTRIYESPETDGLMEPHVFARFNNLNFDVEARFSDYRKRPWLCIGDGYKVETMRWEDEFRSTLQQSKVVHNIVKVVSNSPCIEQLWIILRVDVGIDWVGGQSFIDDLVKGDNLWYMIDRLTPVAAKHITDIIIESGLLLPLRSLPHVKSVKFAFWLSDQWWQMHLWEDFGQVIHSNWLDSDTA
ncbi:hypothetical protein MMC30_006197 [Trapelia coarctata]|nr:hypothetical protein [Trapelia coarctata]